MPIMRLYNVTLREASAVVRAAIGNFTGQGQEIVLVRAGGLLQLYSVGSGTLIKVMETQLFGTVRALTVFRLVGSQKDFLIVGSDSGRLAVLEYTDCFVHVHLETYGKTGVRRTVPGEYIAVDPRGRAVIVGAAEKTAFVYVLNRDSEGRVTISAPLEAHTNDVAIHALVGIDVGFSNPSFAAIEKEYLTGNKLLVHYELDLGLNHVVRKHSEQIPPTCNLLLTIPGGQDGPSGVLVCLANSIFFKNDKVLWRVPIPRRINYLEDPKRELIITCGCVHKLRRRFFILLQSDEGDLYRVDIDNDLRIKYFDTVPVASALLIHKSGFLMVIAEYGNHNLYAINNLGDSDSQHEYCASGFVGVDFDNPAASFVYFKPNRLNNLCLVDCLESIDPILDAKVLNLLNQETPQIYALCGRGPNSSFRVIRHGLDVVELAALQFSVRPKGIWSVKKQISDEYDSFIIVCFANSTTCVFKIGETVEEVKDSKFKNIDTILVSQIGECDLLQVHINGLIILNKTEWKCHEEVICATCNQTQIILALSNNEIVCFEYDNTLRECSRKTFDSPITCLDVGELPNDKIRAVHVAVGTADNVIILSLSSMQETSIQTLTSPPVSLCLWRSLLFIGLQNGVLIRSTLCNGELTDSSVRFLGPRPPLIFRYQDGVICLSTRNWIAYEFRSKLRMDPLTYEMLEYASKFTSEYASGIVAVTKNSIRIFSPAKLGSPLQWSQLDFKFTPKKLIFNPKSLQFVILESEQNAYSERQLLELLKKKAIEYEDVNVKDYVQEYPENIFGRLRAGKGKWVSSLKILNPYDFSMQVYPMEEAEAVFSCCILQFATIDNPLPSANSVWYLAVGSVVGLKYPDTFQAAYIRMYRFKDNTIEFIHKTMVEAMPLALAPFHGRLCAGVGKVLRIYDLGLKKLLKKTELKSFPTQITFISSQGTRLIVADLVESIFFVLYRYSDNKLFIFADDPVARYVSCVLQLDYDTVAVGDKFGTLCVLRIPDYMQKEEYYDKPFLNSAPNKLEIVAQIYLGDTITSISKTILVAGGREVLVYTTLGGLIGCMIPFVSDYEFYHSLEQSMRQEFVSLIGREHMSYRSYYSPVKCIVDGDLLEEFFNLPAEKKISIAQELELGVDKICEKIEEMRIRAAF